MSDDEIVKHYETILMSTDVYPIEMHRRLYLILKDEPDNSDWQSVSNEVYSIFAEYGNPVSIRVRFVSYRTCQQRRYINVFR